MSKDQLIGRFIYYYEQFYIYAMGNLNFKFKHSERNGKYLSNLIDSLLKLYGKSLGDETLFMFVAFQFNYWHTLNTRLNGAIYLNWFTGRKAIDRWLNRGENWLYFLEEFIKQSKVKRYKEQKQESAGAEVRKVSERRRFFNTPRGLLHCYELDLFDSKAKECLRCDYKGNCELNKQNNKK